jgi:hypothetical protein
MSSRQNETKSVFREFAILRSGQKGLPVPIVPNILPFL